jgi:hypothetical protein
VPASSTIGADSGSGAAMVGATAATPATSALLLLVTGAELPRAIGREVVLLLTGSVSGKRSS